MKHRIAKQALECPNCRTTHVCEIQRDEDGAYAEIETQPCHQDGCTKRLCPSCSQAECAECGLSHCEDHIIIAARGPICGVCFQKAVADGVTARTLMAGGCETCNCNPCECGAGTVLRKDGGTVQYSAMTQGFLEVLRTHRDELTMIEWGSDTFPWDAFANANPQAKEWARRFCNEHRYELSERQCSMAVIQLLRENGGQDGRDDLDDRDAHQIGSERCPPRE